MSSEGTIFLTARGLAVRIDKRRLYSQVTHPLPACTSQLIHASRSLDARGQFVQHGHQVRVFIKPKNEQIYAGSFCFFSYVLVLLVVSKAFIFISD